MAVLEQHCHSNGRWPPQMRPKPTCPGSRRLTDAGDRVRKVVGGLGNGWRVAGKLQVDRCEAATFLQIEKVPKLKTEKGTSCWL
jgi:hypothetical protein